MGKTRVEDALFLHLGKAGGGTVTEEFQSLGFAYGKYSHVPLPKQHHPDENQPAIRTYLLSVRDPIDRFLSNWYWVGTMFCHDTAAQPDPRIHTSHFNAANKAPHEYCRLVAGKKNIQSSTQTAAMIHNEYGGSVEGFLNALCDDADAAVRKQARQNLRWMNHARHSIADWLEAPVKASSKDNQTLLVGMVLEPGFDFESQIAGALAVALANSHALGLEGTTTLSQAQALVRRASEQRASKRAKKEGRATRKRSKASQGVVVDDDEEGAAPRTPASHLHSSKLQPLSNSSSQDGNGSSFPPWVETMHAHRTHALSDRAACCMANTLYRKDYNQWLNLVVTDTTTTTALGELVCHGPEREVCARALVAMAQKHSDRNCERYLPEDATIQHPPPAVTFVTTGGSDTSNPGFQTSAQASPRVASGIALVGVVAILAMQYFQRTRRRQ